MLSPALRLHRTGREQKQTSTGSLQNATSSCPTGPKSIPITACALYRGLQVWPTEPKPFPVAVPIDCHEASSAGIGMG